MAGNLRADYILVDDSWNVTKGNNSVVLSVTANDTFIAANTTQTLTNKTLTAPVLSGTATGTYTLGGTLTITSPTFENQPKFPSGSAAAPSIRHIGGETGFYFPAADTVAATTGGTERLRINSSGNVGIGTTSPSSRLHTLTASGENKLIVEAGATSQAATLSLQTNNTTPGQCIVYMGHTSASTNGQVGYDPGTDALYLFTNNTERMRINSSGNVGIGTTSPGTKLDIKNNGGQLYLQQSNADNGWKITVDDADGNLGFVRRADAGSPSDTEMVTITTGAHLQFNSGYGSVATAFGCRAWVNFNGTGTVAIRASGNVSSITDNGTGNYTVNFTTAMPDANYCGTASFGVDAGTGGNGLWCSRIGDARTTSTFSVRCGRPDNGNLADANDSNVSIFR